MNYRPELDGIRALAILLVITAHLRFGSWVWLSGHHGVTLFFVLSGFLITSVLLNDEPRGLSLKRFWLRRVFRLFPLYYLVLALYCVLIFKTPLGIGRAEQFAKALPFQALYFPEVPFFARPDGAVLPFYHSWSLGIEEKFYLLWPAIAFATRYKTHRLAIALVLCVVCLFAGAPAFPYGAILAGCVMALLNHRYSIHQRFGPAICYAAFAVAAVLQLSMAIFPFLQVPYVLTLAVFINTLHNRTVVQRILSLPPLVWIGKVSYGIYLIHILCLNAAGFVTHSPLLNYLATITISVAVATVLHFAIERPLIDYGRKRFRGKVPDPVAQASPI